ncbi:MAG: hypothetical protein AB1400_04275 [Pseudomonadota bacterium]
MSDTAISADALKEVKAILKQMGLDEIRSNTDSAREGLYFASSNNMNSHFNVFIPPLHQRPWKLKVVIAGNSHFSDYQMRMYNELVRNLDTRFGNQNVAADIHSNSGQKLLSSDTQ